MTFPLTQRARRAFPPAALAALILVASLSFAGVARAGETGGTPAYEPFVTDFPKAVAREPYVPFVTDFGIKPAGQENVAARSSQPSGGRGESSAAVLGLAGFALALLVAAVALAAGYGGARGRRRRGVLKPQEARPR